MRRSICVQSAFNPSLRVDRVRNVAVHGSDVVVREVLDRAAVEGLPADFHEGFGGFEPLER